MRRRRQGAGGGRLGRSLCPHEVLEVVADEPQQQIRVRPGTHERIRVRACLRRAQRLRELMFLLGPLFGPEPIPLRREEQREEAVELVQPAISWSESPAAATTRSRMSSSWASDRNQHSNCEGGSITPRASIARWKRAKRERSARSASASDAIGPPAKNTVRSEPARCTQASMPAPAMARSRPPSSRAPSESSLA